jgi:hypothetical protein
MLVSSLNVGLGSAGAIKAGDEEVAVSGSLRLPRLEIALGQPPLEQAPARPGREPWGTEEGMDEKPTRTQYPCQLGGQYAPSRLGDQVEEFVGVWQGAPSGLLEGDPPLWVEPNLLLCFANPVGGAIGAAHTGAGKLTGEEERRTTVITTDHQRPLRRRDVKHSGGERLQRRDFHGAMIASP